MTLLELMGLLRRNLKLVVILPVVLALVVGVYSFAAMANTYTAEVSIYALYKSDSNGTGQDISYTDLSASQMLANDFVELAENDQVQNKVAQSLGLEDLDDFKVAINSSTTSRVIKIDVTGADPERTAAVANALAKVVGDTAVDVMSLDAVNVISQAEVPEAPSGPNRLMYIAVAFLAGLFIAVAIVVVRDMLNTTLRSDEEAEELLGVPVVGRYPYVKSKGGR